MTFEKKHWENPRKSIATRFEENDYGYVLHAGKLFIEFLRASNISYSSAKNMRILDYGCGTGRVTRFFSMFFKQADGYDPVNECIQEFQKEQLKTDGNFKKPFVTSDFQKITSSYDVIVCINVLEHLSDYYFYEAIENMEKKVKDGGKIYLWVHRKNSNFFSMHKIELPIKNISIIEGSRVGGFVKYKNAS